MNKWNNRFVLIFFALVLAGVYWLYRESKNREPMLVTELLGVNTDSTSIDEILIYPETENRSEVKIRNINGDWFAFKNDKKYFADQTAINEVLDALLLLKIDKITATNPNVWKRYGLEEQSSSTVKLTNKDQDMYIVHLGKFDMISQSSKGRTYFRIGDRNEIFETSGFLSMNINRGFDSWRDKSLFNSDPTQWTSMVFEYPGDSSYTIERSEKKLWKINNINIDSTKVYEYAQSISGLSESNFVYDLPERNENTMYRLKIKLNTTEQIILTAIPIESNEFVLLCTKNPDSWFRSHKSGLIKNIFKGRSYFISENN